MVDEGKVRRRAPRKQSAGILVYRQTPDRIEVLLVHPGGPLWARKDEHAWSIPKGEFGSGEDPLEAARREFREKTGLEASGPFLPLGEVRQPGGKTVFAWATPGDCDPSVVRSNRFSMEWPPRSGKMQSFPEIDRAAWFDAAGAPRKLHQGQEVFIARLREKLHGNPR